MPMCLRILPNILLSLHYVKVLKFEWFTTAPRNKNLIKTAECDLIFDLEGSFIRG